MSTAVTPSTNGTKQQQVAVKEKVDPVYSLRHAMNRLFDEFTMGLPFPKIVDDFSGLSPRVDIKETEKEVTITAEMPGIKPDEIELQILGDNLVLSGEKHAEKEEKKANYHRIERSYGSFQRTLPLPSGIDHDAITATSEHGVLTIKLPKTKAAQEQAKKIEVKAK